MSQTLSTRDVKLGNWILSVTTRDTGDDPKILEELTYRTVIMWVNIVRRLEKENYVYEGGSVEQVYAAEINKRTDTDGPNVEPFEFKEPWGSDNSRVTVWSTFRGTENPNFHLNSDDIPQTAIDVWRANGTGIERAYLKLESLMPKPSQPAQDTQQPAPQATTASNTNKFKPLPHEYKNWPKESNDAPNQPVSGTIVATRAPSPNRCDYANGQLVSFTVNKIVATSNKGSAVYQMWTALGTQYPTVSVYKLKPDGNIKPDYEAIVPVLNMLNLTLDNPEAVGTWRLICKAVHVPGTNGDKEYMNVVSLTAI